MCVCELEKEGEKRRGREVLLPFWARGKSNKTELMGLWSLRGQKVDFAGRHWWVMLMEVNRIL